MYYDNEPTEPMEPPLEAFFGVIRSILESPYTTEKTRDVAVLLLVCTTVNRSLFTTGRPINRPIIGVAGLQEVHWGLLPPKNPRLTQTPKTESNCSRWKHFRPKCFCGRGTSLGEVPESPMLVPKNPLLGSRPSTTNVCPSGFMTRHIPGYRPT